MVLYHALAHVAVARPQHEGVTLPDLDPLAPHAHLCGLLPQLLCGGLLRSQQVQSVRLSCGTAAHRSVQQHPAERERGTGAGGPDTEAVRDPGALRLRERQRSEMCSEIFVENIGVMSVSMRSP